MTKDEFLTEKMGLYWTSYKPDQEDFSTWEGFGKLWEWAKVQEWWGTFIIQKQFIWLDIIHPDRFANAVAKYLGWR